jgi:hypothetical protein
MKFSLFKNKNGNFIPNQVPVSGVSLEDLAISIKSNDSIKRFTKEYREEYALEGKTSKTDAMKKRFPHFTPIGEFAVKNNNGFIKESWSGCVGFDIDRGDNPDINWDILFQNITITPEITLVFRSPSNGIKGLIRTEFEFNLENFSERVKSSIYPYFEKLWGCSLDYKQATLSQSMFICHDESVYATLEAVVYKPQQSISIFDYVPNADKDDRHLMNLLKSLSEVPPGQVFSQTQKFSILAAKMIKGGAWDIEPNNAFEILWDSLRRSPGVSDADKGKADLKTQFFGAIKKSQFAPITKQDLKMDDIVWKIKKFLKEDYWLETSPYLKIATKWYKKDTNKLILWDKTSIFDAHPKNVANMLLERSIKLDEFINCPDYLNYNQIVDNKWNLSQGIIHEVQEGEWGSIRSVLRHIFSEQYEMILDWLQLSYTAPKQALPIPCLVSMEQGTGKTTFLELINILFEGNTVGISIEDFSGQFNSHFAHKNFILIDETETSDTLMKQVGPKIKRWVTQSKVQYHAKGVTPVEIDYYGKIVICSNDETGFIKITNHDKRYWIVKVPVLKKYDKNIFAKIKEEAGHFLHYLSKRELSYPVKESRLWFPEESYITETFNDAAEEGKTWLYHELKEIIQEDLAERSVEEYYYSSTELNEIVSQNTKQSFTRKYLRSVMVKEFNLGEDIVKNVNGINKRGWEIKKSQFSVIEENNSNDSKNDGFNLF